MGDEAFTAGTPEAELEREGGQPVMVGDERGKLGWVMLTNDRILFTHQKFATGAGGGLAGAVIVNRLQKRSEEKAGGPREVAVLAEIRRAGPVKRRLLADLYEFEHADGSSVRLAGKLGIKWSPIIRRLLVERHGLSVVDDGEGWSVSG